MKTKPQTAPHGDAELLAVAAEIGAEHADWKAGRVKEADDYGERVSEMEQRFAEMPVHTLSGVVAKLRHLRGLLVDDGTLRTADIVLVETVLAGLERVLEAVSRLAGRTQDGEPNKAVALEAEYRKVETEWKALSKDSPDKHAEAVGARFETAIEAFATAPANSLEGIALKMKLLIEGMKNQHSWEPELAQTALEGVERLAGKAS